MADPNDGVTYVSQAGLIGLQGQAALLGATPNRAYARLSGQYLSSFRGRGMEFDEARPYQPGDDIRNMDWRVTARTNKPHSKLFREERERPVLLWVDFRPSMFFGTRVCYKSVLAARLAALIGWVANRDGDRLGGLLFNQSGHLELRPGRGKKAVLRLMSELARFSRADVADAPSQQPFDPQQPLNRLVGVTRPGSRVVLISDFRDPGERFEYSLAKLGAHNELLLLQVYDPLEAELPLEGRYRVCDGKDEALIDANDARRRDDYAARFNQRQARLQKLAHKYRLDYRSISTSDQILRVLRNERQKAV